MPLTEIIVGQERTYRDDQLMPHTEWGKLLYLPEGTIKLAIKRSNSTVVVIYTESAVRYAATPAGDLPKMLSKLAELRSANGPSVFYSQIVQSIDLSKDFSFKTPRGTVIFRYLNPSRTETTGK